MPSYRLTIDARRSDSLSYEWRTFYRYVQADTARHARGSIGNRSVVDPSDGAWFDEWTITATRKVTRYEVVTTDCHAWHSRGITGITVFYSKREANRYLARTLTGCKPNQGAFLRTVK